MVTRPAPEKALLLAVSGKGSHERQTALDSLEELALLTASAGAIVVDKIVQQLPTPSHDYYVGRGKIQDLLALKDKKGFSVLILDDELTPKQQENLEKALDVKVIDRVALILDIFAKRARTHEGRLQVELAQHQYLLPRLAGQWSHLERLGGGIGTRGPGESQLETDRRLIRRKIQRLEEQNAEISRRRALYRQQRQRSRVPVVALVGYTNAGKSTLLNSLCKTNILADDRLFATLDPTTRRLNLPDNSTVLLSDTVGFIRKLPPTIVHAFRATLEELSEADLLLHVVDVSSPEAPEQCQAVEKILADLELTNKKRVTVLNKIDCLFPDEPLPGGEGLESVIATLGIAPDDSTVIISASKGWGLPRLLNVISGSLKAAITA
ncbi:MAG: GTPase HflX [Dehalococcoidales bacterium]|nr:GTPase HflX [Dehalococcoidales bacterium]